MKPGGNTVEGSCLAYPELIAAAKRRGLPVQSGSAGALSHDRRAGPDGGRPRSFEANEEMQSAYLFQLMQAAAECSRTVQVFFMRSSPSAHKVILFRFAVQRLVGLV